MTSANVVYAILATVKDIGSAPSGVVYAGLMSKGVSHSSYSGIIEGLIKARLLKQVNNILTLTDMGKELVSKVDAELQRKGD